MATNKKLLLLPDAANHYYDQAVFHLERKDLAKAEKYFRKTLEKDPDNPNNHCNLAIVLSERDLFEQSNTIFKNILQKIDPDMYECYFFMANNYAHMEQYRMAEEMAVSYLRKAPAGDFASDAIEMLTALSEDFGCGELYRTYETERARDLAIKINRCQKLIENGSLTKAVFLIEQTRQEHPRNIQLLQYMADLSALLGDPSDAIRIIRESIQIAPTSIGSWVRLAHYQHQHQLFEDLQNTIKTIKSLNIETKEDLLLIIQHLSFSHQLVYDMCSSCVRKKILDDHILYCIMATSASNRGFHAHARKFWELAESKSSHPYIASRIRMMDTSENGVASIEDTTYSEVLNSLCV